MPLVFVHGVNTREGNTDEQKAEFERRVASRDELFRTIALADLVPPSALLHIENPYWGKYAADFTHNLASIPGSDTEHFGSAAEDAIAEVLTQTLSPAAAARLKSENAPAAAILLALARQEPETMLPLALDALIAAAASQQVEDGDNAAGAEQALRRQEVARFAAAARAYLNSKPDLGWLFERHPVTGEPLLTDDDQLLDALDANLKPFLQTQPRPEHFGGGKMLNWLKGVASTLGTAAKKTVSVIAATGVGAFVGASAAGGPGGSGALKLLRPMATQRAGIFLGDVFAYLGRRSDDIDNPGDIVRIVRDALRTGDANRSEKDSKLIVVAHSMGGNIVYDIITYYDPNIKVDVLLTVGSQVALFKELLLYQEDRGKKHQSGAGLVKKPDSVGFWVNVFDPLDVLGFAASSVFEGVTDYAFLTQAGPLDAHSTYFLRPSFHDRLRARLAAASLGVAV